jgi:hypothetical protein
VSTGGGDPHALPSGSNAPERVAYIGAFVDQARWLIEVHTARGDSVQQRATALLGLIGVMLSLILTGLADRAVPRVVPAPA